MTPEEFRLYVHQVINELAYQLKYAQVRNYDKVYKDAAVVRITGKVHELKLSQ